ncbi:LysE family transporter [Cellulomonas sp. C5510]|uniref:LysE family transporter n=1 Tax=Cellulomonas sp. C5510 TaxID=2871170 RepID=UPI001C96705B|nr:LysE family transporter [Cellulomonas sp. C5510]QZN85839.1 LysE family transporter [Cellulomonas sp. C5510]
MTPLPDGPVAALASGVLAGLGVAVPLGPVGVLVVRTSALDGLRRGLAAAAGVAAVDCGYAALAATAGAALSRVLAGRERAVALVAALVLVVVGGALLRGALAVARPAAPADDGEPQRPAAALRVALRFVLLTAVNPLTLVTFAAVAASLPGRPAGVWFVTGVAAASAAWQTALAGAGAALGRRVGAGGRRLTGVVGAGAVLVAAAVALVRAV